MLKMTNKKSWRKHKKLFMYHKECAIYYGCFSGNTLFYGFFKDGIVLFVSLYIIYTTFYNFFFKKKFVSLGYCAIIIIKYYYTVCIKYYRYIVLLLSSGYGNIPHISNSVYYSV